MKPDKRRQALWSNEYEHLQGIRLGYTESRPPSVELFLACEKESGRTFERILDVGCGKGRIGLHLALEGRSVTGFDFAPAALEAFAETAAKHRVDNLITHFRQDIGKPWNLPDLSFDAVFAVTVVDNLTHKDGLLHFRGEILRVLAPGGLFVLEFYLRDDGYYGPLLGKSPDRESGLLVDPNNGITFALHSRDDLVSLFERELTILSSETLRFESLKYGKLYRRRSQVIVFEKQAPNSSA